MSTEYLETADEAAPPAQPQPAPSGGLASAVVQLTIVGTALWLLWAGLVSAWQMVSALGHSIRLDLGIFGLAVGLRMLARQPWTRLVTLGLCWFMVVFLPVVALLALSGTVPVTYHLPSNLAGLAGPPAILLLTGGLLLASLWVYTVFNSSAGRIWFGLNAGASSSAVRPRWLAALAVTTLALGGAWALAFPERRLEPVSMRGGMLTDVAVAGHHAFALMGGGVGVLDLSDPDRPRLVGQTLMPWAHTPADVTQLAIVADGDKVFVSNPETPAVRLLDVSDPVRPRMVGDTVLEQRPRSLAVADGTLYVLGDLGFRSNQSELATLSSTGMVTPTVSARWRLAGLPRALEVSEGQALVLTGPNCWLCEESAARPVTLAVFDLSADDLAGPVGLLELPTTSIALARAGAYGYVLTVDGQLLTVNLSDPAHPTHESTLRLRNPATAIRACTSAFVGWGEHLFVGDQCSGEVMTLALLPGGRVQLAGTVTGVPATEMTAALDRLFAVDAAGPSGNDNVGLSIVDIRTPERPRLSGTWNSFTARRVVPIGSRAYVVSMDEGLRVLGITDPAMPTDLGAIGPGDVVDAASAGQELFVVTRPGSFGRLSATGELAGTVALGPASPDSAWRILAIADDIAYLSDSFSRTLRLVDVANPAQPTLRAQIELGGTAASLAASDGYAYVGICNRGAPARFSSTSGAVVPQVQVLDIRNADAPRPVGTIDSWHPLDCSSAVQVDNGTLYLSSTDGLRTYDLADPAHPGDKQDPAERAGWSLAQTDDGMFSGSNTLRLFGTGYFRRGDLLAELPGLLGASIAAQDRHVFVADAYRGLVTVAVDRGPVVLETR